MTTFVKNRAFYFIFLIALFLGALNGCTSNNTRGFIWLGDPVITTGLDADGEPIDEIKEFTSPIDRVHCFLRIRGPNQARLGVRWYYQDELILTEVMVFGSEKKASVFLAREGDDPLPSGKYRCEIYAVDEPLRTAEFLVK